MRRNKRHTKVISVVASRAMYLAAVIMMLFVMVIVNALALSRRSQIMTEIGNKKMVLAELEKKCERESSTWNQLCTPENLEKVLSRLAMPMRYPSAEQVVRMDARGVPEPGQISVVRAERRRARERSAQASNDVKPRATSTRRRKK